MEARVAKDLEGKSSAEQEALGRAYADWGIPYSTTKSLQKGPESGEVRSYPRW